MVDKIKNNLHIIIHNLKYLRFSKHFVGKYYGDFTLIIGSTVEKHLLVYNFGLHLQCTVYSIIK